MLGYKLIRVSKRGPRWINLTVLYMVPSLATSGTGVTHYNDVIMSKMASQITGQTIVYSTVYSGTDERKHRSYTSLAFVRRIHRWPVNSPHKLPVTRKMLPFDDVIMPLGWRMSVPNQHKTLQSANRVLNFGEYLCLKLYQLIIQHHWIWIKSLVFRKKGLIWRL